MKNSAKVTSFRKTTNGSYQYEITQLVDTRSSVNAGNLLSMMNEGDDRFTNNGPKARKSWSKVTPESAMKAFGIDITGLAYDAQGNCPVSIENPSIGGLEFNIKIVESTDMTILKKEASLSDESIQYLIENKESRAKQIPANETQEARYFVKNGQLVFSIPVIVLGEPNHVLEKEAVLTNKSELFTVSASIAESIKSA